MYLGGYLASAAMAMVALRLGSFLMGRSALVYGVELYGGLMMFSAYILYDTQVRSWGQRGAPAAVSYIHHSELMAHRPSPMGGDVRDC